MREVLPMTDSILKARVVQNLELLYCEKRP